MNYVAFDKDHNIIEGDTLEWIVSLAKLGYITEAGKKLVLIPDTRFGSPDIAGLREFANGQTVGVGKRAKRLPRIRKGDCIPLPNLVPKHLRPA